ncbi:MAG: amidohydrolase family protein [Chthoniobacterales bacterium]
MSAPPNIGREAVIPLRIWDGDQALEGQAVLVADGRIEAVLPAGEIPAGVPRRDLPDCTLLPGLIDAHVHYAASCGPAYLAAGVTTVRDVGNDLGWILGQKEKNLVDPARGPRILCCGWALDGMEGIWQQIAKRHPDEDSLRAAIRDNVSHGVDAIKLYASLSEPMLRAGVEEGHAHGLKVLAHLNSTSAEEASAARLDEIEHFSRCDVAWREATTEEDDRLIDRFLAHGTAMNPTVNVWDRLGRAMEHAFLHDGRRRWLHPQLLEIWERFPYRRCEASKRLRYQSMMPHIKRFLLRCHERDVVLGAGTDSPFINLLPGFGLHDELAQYVDAGLRPVDALRAATVANARLIGLEKSVGRIRAGMDADLLAVAGNPLERIDDIGNVKAVFRRGIPLEPDDLLTSAQGYFATPIDDPIIRDLQHYVSGELPSYSQKS